MHKGSCLCGAVKIAVEGDLPRPNACHCVACRKHGGHYGASLDVPRAALRVEAEDTVRWYQSSEKVRRGFCGVCGSTLFWDPIHHDWTAIAMGVFDGPTDTSLSMHIFVSEKGDYYEIADELPRNET
ncbi:GFA family protein [Ponticoccus alexandrii]|uniref:GFA family protein n=1 Tax=Ponticoccus alexandrii TaxID=1943633 RepID=A0ABX7F3Q6_9RHOB|nr:GFA family protein [Ponticoccus alexandrii]ETA53613.2 aldehyde-activating protein [Rhodobacteraceae bacterium PD-2]QRF64937.1 GFA family protein [Ponticoccus alexandrii]